MQSRYCFNKRPPGIQTKKLSPARKHIFKRWMRVGDIVNFQDFTAISSGKSFDIWVRLGLKKQQIKNPVKRNKVQLVLLCQGIHSIHPHEPRSVDPLQGIIF